MTTNEKVSVSPHFVTRPFESDGNHIPWIVTELIDVLTDKEAHEVEGIFRLSGSQVVVANLMEELDRGPVRDYSKYDAVTIACALKSFFRAHSKEDPLVPFELYDEMIAISNIEEADAIKQLSAVIKKMSRGRQVTLCYLMFFLSCIAENSEKNKMKASNLAICVAPNILVPPIADPALIMYRNECQNKIVTMMIEHNQEIFGDVKLTSDEFMKSVDIQIIARSVSNEVQIDQIRKRWKYRSESVIPYVPTHLFNDPTFKRPMEPYQHR